MSAPACSKSLLPSLSTVKHSFAGLFTPTGPPLLAHATDTAPVHRASLRGSGRLRQFDLLCLLLSLALLCFFPIALPAQSVTFGGPGPSVNFGNVNLCAVGHTTPAPCSETLTLTYNVTAGGTLGTPKVLTLGAPNLDFTLASGPTCTGSVTTAINLHCQSNVRASLRR